MSDGPGFLDSIGLHIQDIVAGFAGGVANAIVFRKSSPGAMVMAIILGGVAANYLGETMYAILSSVPVLKISRGTADFLVGLGGMRLMQYAAERLTSLPLLKEWKKD